MDESQPPLSLYIHLPWCVRKCPYCDFNSFAVSDNVAFDRYADAVLVDLEIEALRVQNRELVSIFIGGGTPSLFSPGHIERLLAAASRHFRFAADIEITMEANPGTIECGDPAGYRQAGVNRLSIGAQSFDPAALEVLGRIHSIDDIDRSVRDARAAGFTNINLDLMYALPGQIAAAAMSDIQRAADLGPAHISWYQLTLEPNTVFHARPPAGLPDEDAVAGIEEQGREFLAGRGFEQYEVSAYARDGARSVHNLNYWQFGDYAAVGAGAHGKISEGTDIRRYFKPANPQQYMQALESGQYAAELSALSGVEQIFEFMLNALRLTDGVDETLFEARTTLSAADLRSRLAGVRDKGLIEEKRAGLWCKTALGGRFLNDLQAEFLPD